MSPANIFWHTFILAVDNSGDGIHKLLQFHDIHATSWYL